MTRLSVAAAAALLVAAAAPAAAQVRQSVQIGAGLFMPRGVDGRSDDDVLKRNFVGEPMPVDPSVTDALAFEMGDFRSGLVFGEWNVALTPQVEVSFGIGGYGGTVPTLYADVVDELTETDIEQELSLRVVPISGIVRFLPFARPGEIQPYLGVGISALNFRYREAGDFVDPFTFDIYTDEFEDSGTALGTMILGGVRVPVGRRGHALSIEGRYQFGTGNLDEDEFLTDKIDLGGGQIVGAFLVRF